MKKRWISAASMLLAVCLCLTMTACGKKWDDVYKTGSDYSLVTKDGKSYIVFDNISKYTANSNLTGESMMAGIEFSSMKEMKDAVIKGTLTVSQKAVMAKQFEKDKSGAILTCDFNKLYVPTLPSGSSVISVIWLGDTCNFELSFDNNVTGGYRFYKEEQYQAAYKKNYEDRLFKNEKISIRNIENLPDNKQVIYYTTSAGEFKNIRYVLSDGSKSFIVEKEFFLRLNHTSFPVSDTVPDRIALYCTEKEQYYSIHLYEFAEDPTDEWLLQFGITEFVDQ